MIETAHTTLSQAPFGGEKTDESSSLSFWEATSARPAGELSVAISILGPAPEGPGSLVSRLPSLGEPFSVSCKAQL